MTKSTIIFGVKAMTFGGGVIKNFTEYIKIYIYAFL